MSGLNRSYKLLSWTPAALAVAIVLNCAALATAQSKTRIRVSAESIVANDNIRLGEIASITGEPNRSTGLKSVSLGYAPQVGSMRAIDRDQINLAITATGLAQSDFILDSPPSVRIRRIGQEVSAAVIRTEIEQKFLFKLTAQGVTFSVVRLELPKDIRVPIGKLEIRIDGSAIRSRMSVFTLLVEIRVEGKIVGRWSATVELEAFADVLVAARDLTAKERITGADVRAEKRKLAGTASDYVRDPAKLKGAMLTKNVAAGTELLVGYLVAGTVVQAGDGVNIEAHSGGVKIIVRGEARSSGKIGDRIAVKNAASGVILQARVIDDGLVSVIF